MKSLNERIKELEEKETKCEFIGCNGILEVCQSCYTLKAKINTLSTLKKDLLLQKQELEGEMNGCPSRHSPYQNSCNCSDLEAQISLIEKIIGADKG